MSFSTEPSSSTDDIPPYVPITLPEDNEVIEQFIPSSEIYTDQPQLKRKPREEEEPYFDASMKPNYTAYIGKSAIMTCIVHAAKTDKSVSFYYLI